jgi:uncharacterized membrane protein YbhN (UPF0104 family)
VCILALLVWQVGTRPFLDGVRLVDGSAVVAAFGIGVLITVCCAWRWSLVAAGLGVRLPLREAVAACYRSQFLNTTLPGGVIGDVHRAIRHGLDIGDVGLGVRAVVLERLAGQTVQAAIALIVLFAFPSPVWAHLPVATIGLVVAGLGVVVVGRALARGGSARWVRALRRAGSDIRYGLFARREWVGVVLASSLVVAGHLATFVLAARTAGSTAPLALLVPLTLLALLAMVVPLNLGGWGPREGVAAWAFGAAGLTATQGVATAVTYGVLVLIASLPGAVVLVIRWIGRELDTNCGPDPALSRVPAFRRGDVGG